MRQLTSLMVTALPTAMVALTGCTRQIEGSAATGSRDVDPAYFFAGEVPTYGQTVGPNEVTVPAYLRAMRRIDPCGLVTRDAMAKIGEIGSVGTLFALEECDVDIKVPGETERRFVTIVSPSPPPTTRASRCERATFRSTRPYPGSCDYLLLFGGDFIDTGDVVIRPTLVVDSGGGQCEVAADVATAAAKLYS